MSDQKTSPVQVVLIEDHESYRAGLMEHLNASDRLVCTAYATVDEAMKAMAVVQPDAVIMDIHLGDGADGIQGTRTIKQRWPKVQVMICTVHEDDGKIFDALRAGATGYILKRTPLEDMLEALDQLLAGGSPMSPGIARRVVGSFAVQGAEEESSQLSAREREVLERLATGRRVKEIAQDLAVSPNTIRTHIRHIYEKLQVQGRVEAVNKVRAWGWDPR